MSSFYKPGREGSASLSELLEVSGQKRRHWELNPQLPKQSGEVGRVWHFPEQIGECEKLPLARPRTPKFQVPRDASAWLQSR